MHYFNSHGAQKRLLRFVYKYLPLAVFVLYPILLVYLFFTDKLLLLRATALPATVFILVTVLRKLINEPRPYTRYKIPSLFGKDTVGESMPSRHTASAFIIAMVFFRCNAAAGGVMLAIAVIISLSRILGGVHYIRDVAVGAALSLVFSILLFI